MIDFENGSFVKLMKTDSVGKGIDQLLIPGETIIGSYKGIRDSVTFTDRRVIAVNVQGLTGKRRITPHSPTLRYRRFP